MNVRQRFRLGSLAFVGLLSAGNFVPESWKKDVVVPTPVVAPSPSEQVPPLEDAVVRLNGLFSYTLTPRDLVALTRMVYFEGTGDPKVHSQEEQYQSFLHITDVIRNRWLFDTCSNESSPQNPYCGEERQYWYGGEEGLGGIIFKKKEFRDGKGNVKRKVHQFSSLAFRPYFFREESLEKGLNDRTWMGAKKKAGEIKKLNEGNLRLAYKAVLDVLSQEKADVSQGALYYKNSDALAKEYEKQQKTSKDKKRRRSLREAVVWDGRQAFSYVKKDCSQITRIPKRIRTALADYDDLDCRIEEMYVHVYSHTVGSHDYYVVKNDEDLRREVVYHDACAFVDGVYTPSMSSQNYCRL